MKVASGIEDYQVFQRDARGSGGAVVTGTCDKDFSGPVYVNVSSKGRSVRGFTRLKTGKAEAGCWKAELRGLKTGGPYELTFTAGDQKATVKSVLVGDVWIMAGQSNMQGVGNLDGAPEPDPLVRAYDMSDQWMTAEEPVNFLESSVDAFHCKNPITDRKKIKKAKRKAEKGVGPGLAFALEMLRRTGVPQGLIPCAHGGTSIEQWSPRLKNRGGESLYGGMYRRVKKTGQRVAGMLWYQGCSDNGKPEGYLKKMKALVKAVRKDLKQPGLAWLMVQIGKFHPILDAPVSPGWMSIQEQQRRLADEVKNLSVVPAVDLPMDDGIHIGAEGQKVLGRRLARVACYRLKLVKGIKDGIRLKRIRQIPNSLKNPPEPLIEVTFTNVAGELSAPGIPAGFRLIDPEGNRSLRIHKTTCRKNKVILEARIDNDPGMKGYRLAYGYEIDAYCNITDSEGMGLLAFAPQRIERLAKKSSRKGSGS